MWDKGNVTCRSGGFLVVSELICFLEKKKKRENKTTEPKEIKETGVAMGDFQREKA